MPFEFATATRIIFGAGKIEQAGALAREFGRHALVVTGRDARRAQGLLDALREEGVHSVLFSVEGEPDLETVGRGVALGRRENCELVIAMGGGSALDVGKTIAVMLTNEGDVLDYLEIIGGGQTLRRPSAPFMAIPTTAGTGSEVTRNAVFTSVEHRVKASLRSPFMLPKVALGGSRTDPRLAACRHRRHRTRCPDATDRTVCLSARQSRDRCFVRERNSRRALVAGCF